MPTADNQKREQTGAGAGCGERSVQLLKIHQRQVRCSSYIHPAGHG